MSDKSMIKKLTKRQAFEAMKLFLDEYYIETQLDDLGSLLGGMQLLSDGSTADSAIWFDWVGVIENPEMATEGESLSLLKAFEAMKLFLFDFLDSDEIGSLLVLFDSSDCNVWSKWEESAGKAVSGETGVLTLKKD